MTPGELIAALLAGAWRPEPPPLPPAVVADPAAALGSAVSDVLLSTGAGPLTWWRMRNTSLRDHPAVVPFQVAYRSAALQSLLHGAALEALLAQFAEQDVRPLLVKGWGAARVYPEAGLRPYDDFDFYVLPEQRPAAKAVVESFRHPAGVAIELHEDYNFPFDIALEALFGAGCTLSCGRGQVLVPAPEHHLRLLCLHMLYHGGWRPLWLSDLGAFVEAHPHLDPARILTGNQPADSWVAGALLLARDLLGARLSAELAGALPAVAPTWLGPALTRQWASAIGSSAQPSLVRTLCRSWPNLGDMSEAIRLRWQNPLEASLEVGAPFDEADRFPVQVRAALYRLARRTTGRR